MEARREWKMVIYELSKPGINLLTSLEKEEERETNIWGNWKGNPGREKFEFSRNR